MSGARAAVTAHPGGFRRPLPAARPASLTNGRRPYWTASIGEFAVVAEYPRDRREGRLCAGGEAYEGQEADAAAARGDADCDALRREGDHLVATLALLRAGLYTITVTGGGLSPVRVDVLVVPRDA